MCPSCKLSNSLSLQFWNLPVEGILDLCWPLPKFTVGSNTHKSRILVEAGFHKLLEGLAVVTLKCWRVVFGDQEENPHRMQVRIWRLSLC